MIILVPACLNQLRYTKFVVYLSQCIISLHGNRQCSSYAVRLLKINNQEINACTWWSGDENINVVDFVLSFIDSHGIFMIEFSLHIDFEFSNNYNYRTCFFVSVLQIHYWKQLQHGYQHYLYTLIIILENFTLDLSH